MTFYYGHPYSKFEFDPVKNRNDHFTMAGKDFLRIWEFQGLLGELGNLARYEDKRLKALINLWFSRARLPIF